ncbi:hypothetical protein PF002_g8866 [Phytophthora fragariae]|uniref:Uncharacterized protein n=1 Tax=Phytophthora fragariae TaxID=53985 RepID=A0A6A3ZT90_9STRA|nr:hypothetical protein PF003_g28393 [Phytophthora fragariae]KAE8941656.1 hypothetical protein PF009_g8560 [Phytophthora fragariae]KAE9147498.1 hypothetical protein PF006_g7816 [Phytophthora fragariae]KAE9241838.1 hypothetical protein PF004_g6869 [Phytophthora fragariae]KAE9242206.1 hypothetical protein PF002_g8866 [Phytophthora fragariae]
MPRAPNILVGVQITAIRTASAAFGVSRRICFSRSSSLLVLIRSACLPRCSSIQSIVAPAPG